MDTECFTHTRHGQEVGKHISMENILSQTIVWHFVTIFCF